MAILVAGMTSQRVCPSCLKSFSMTAVGLIRSHGPLDKHVLPSFLARTECSSDASNTRPRGIDNLAYSPLSLVACSDNFFPSITSKTHSSREIFKMDPESLQVTGWYEVNYNFGGHGKKEWCTCLGEVAAVQCTLSESAISMWPQLALGHISLLTDNWERGRILLPLSGRQGGARTVKSDRSLGVLGLQSVIHVECRGRRFHRCSFSRMLWGLQWR